MREAPSAVDHPRSNGYFVAFSVGLSLGLAVAVILERSWDDCGVAMPLFNVLAAGFDGLVTALVTGLIFLAAGRRQDGRSRTIIAASLILAVLVAYCLLAFMLPASVSGGFFANNGAGMCPGNVPHWWPSWLPI